MNKQELIKKIKEMPVFATTISKISLVRKCEVLKLIAQLNQVERLDVPQKVTLPQFVADWIEYCKRHNFTLFGCLDPVDSFEVLVGEDFEGDARKCIVWCRSASDKVARSWLDGYEVEEKRYRVKMKGIEIDEAYLKFQSDDKYWYMGIVDEYKHGKTHHTRKELEKAGFGWVFDCPGIEIEEVEG